MFWGYDTFFIVVGVCTTCTYIVYTCTYMKLHIHTYGLHFYVGPGVLFLDVARLATLPRLANSSLFLVNLVFIAV